ncbi:ParB/RepB/Spo0J family partition protein [Streptomyces canus]|uniref:ParB/RepB/Spo0J family partition protein n=1 Tax=Streptomyces canus TaxID=58343 RepID=UPI00358F95E0
MNRDAYVAANPAREADLEADTTHVVIDGSSRLAAAREAQLTTIKIMVSDDQGTTSEELLESALVANIHRQDLEELDEARALQRLLAIHGSQTALAKRLQRSQGWVSQRLALLNLTPDLQARIGEEPVDLLRAVGNKPAAEQKAALEELKTKRARQEAEKRERSGRKQANKGAPPTADAPPVHYGVRDGPDGTAGSEQRDDHTAAEAAVPEPRGSQEPVEAEPAGERQLPKLPYDDPVHIAMHLKVKMNKPTFLELFRLLAAMAHELDSAQFEETLRRYTDGSMSKAS